MRKGRRCVRDTKGRKFAAFELAAQNCAPAPTRRERSAALGRGARQPLGLPSGPMATLSHAVEHMLDTRSHYQPRPVPSPLKGLKTSRGESLGQATLAAVGKFSIAAAGSPTRLIGSGNSRRYLDQGETAGVTKYLRSCERVGISPEPLLLRTLTDPKAHGGSYSSADAERGLNEESVAAIVASVDAFVGMTKLQLVGLQHPPGAPMLSRAAMEVLARTAKAAPSLTVLDLSHNALGDGHAAEMVAKLLAGNDTLRSLVLRHNNLGPATARAAFAALGGKAQTNKKLRELDFSCNAPLAKWRAQGNALATLLQTNTSLEYLGASIGHGGHETVPHSEVEKARRSLSLKLAHFSANAASTRQGYPHGSTPRAVVKAPGAVARRHSYASTTQACISIFINKSLFLYTCACINLWSLLIMCAHLSFHLSIYIWWRHSYASTTQACISLHLSMYLYLYISVCVSIYTDLCVYLSMFVDPSFYLSIYIGLYQLLHIYMYVYT